MTRRDILPIASLVLPLIALVISCAQLIRTAQRSNDRADEALGHWQQCIDESRQLRGERTDLRGILRAPQRASFDPYYTAFPASWECFKRASRDLNEDAGVLHWECRRGTFTEAKAVPK